MDPTAEPESPNRLRELRLERGLSQEKLARRADLSLFTVNRLENGGNRPSLRSARKLARALGAGIDTIFPRDRS